MSCFQGVPCDSAGKESACNAGDLGLIPGLGRSPGEGKGCPLQYSGLENSMDFIVHGVAKSQTGLSDFHFHLLSGMLLANWIISPTLPSSLSGSYSSKYLPEKMCSLNFFFLSSCFQSPKSDLK